MWFYSKSTFGFYNTEIHGKAIPEDAVEITEQYHRELLYGQSNGKSIYSNDRGYPILGPAVIISDEEMAQRMKTANTAG
jgi:hypothetical protein